MTESQFVSALLESARACGTPLSETSAAQCLEHVRLMLVWNRRTNLTRITDLDEILDRHVMDSLIPSRFLPPSGHGVDVGSGAGFPGVILALAHPDLHMTLIESSRKKASFLKVLSTRVGLPNLSVFHGSWQEWLATPTEDGGPPVACITMRAVRLESVHLEELARKGLLPGGVFALWAGPSGTGDAREGGKVEGLRPMEPVSYTLPARGDSRLLLRWERLPQDAMGQ